MSRKQKTKVTRKRVHLIATHPLAPCSFTLRRGVIMINNRKVRPSRHLPRINNRKTVVGFLNTMCSWSVGKTCIHVYPGKGGGDVVVFWGEGGRKSSQPVRFVEDTRFLQENVSSNVLAFASLTTHYETHLYYYSTLKSRHEWHVLPTLKAFNIMIIYLFQRHGVTYIRYLHLTHQYCLSVRFR